MSNFLMQRNFVPCLLWPWQRATLSMIQDLDHVARNFRQHCRPKVLRDGVLAVLKTHFLVQNIQSIVHKVEL